MKAYKEEKTSHKGAREGSTKNTKEEKRNTKGTKKSKSTKWEFGCEG